MKDEGQPLRLCVRKATSPYTGEAGEDRGDQARQGEAKEDRGRRGRQGETRETVGAGEVQRRKQKFVKIINFARVILEIIIYV